jgi:hypothetical protein
MSSSTSDPASRQSEMQALPGAVHIANGRYPDYVLGAKRDAGDTSVWLFKREDTLRSLGT